MLLAAESRSSSASAVTWHEAADVFVRRTVPPMVPSAPCTTAVPFKSEGRHSSPPAVEDAGVGLPVTGSIVGEDACVPGEPGAGEATEDAVSPGVVVR